MKGSVGDNADWVIKFVDKIAKDLIGGGDNQTWIGIRDEVRKGLSKFEHDYEFTNWINGRTDLSQDQKWNVESSISLVEVAFELNNKLNGAI